MGLPADLIGESEGFRYNDGGIYPDNEQTVKVYRDLLTQWRQGPRCATGIDYTALPVVFRLRRVKLSDREEIFDGLQVMEGAALEVIFTRVNG